MIKDLFMESDTVSMLNNVVAGVVNEIFNENEIHNLNFRASQKLVQAILFRYIRWMLDDLDSCLNP